MVWPEYGGYKPGDDETWGATQHVNAGAWLGFVVCVVLQVCNSRGPGGATTVKPGHQEKPDSLTPAQCRGDGAAAQAPPTIAGGLRRGNVCRPAPAATRHRIQLPRGRLRHAPGMSTGIGYFTDFCRPFHHEGCHLLYGNAATCVFQRR